MRQAEPHDPQPAGAGVEIADVLRYRALHQLEADFPRYPLLIVNKRQNAIGQVMAVEQVGGQVDGHRNVIALLTPLRLGFDRLAQHVPQQGFFQAVKLERGEEHARQQHPVLGVHPAHQCLGGDDATIGQGLLGLKPGLQLTVVEGIEDRLALEARSGLGLRGIAQAHELIGQAAQGGGLDRFRDQADDLHSQVARHQAGRHQHTPRGCTHDCQGWPAAQGCQALDELHAIHAGHQQVGEDQVELTPFQARERFGAIACHLQMEITQFAEQVLQVQVLEGVVFDNQNATGLHGEFFHKAPGN
ncbi:hypothetical protein D9M71_455260 [compost metagenome]